MQTAGLILLTAFGLPGAPAEDASEGWSLGEPRFGALELRAGEKGPIVQQRFLGQMRLELQEGPGEPESLTLPRIRSITQVDLLQRRLSFKLHFNVSPASIELLDYVFQARLLPGLVLGLGQSKIPLTRHRVASVSRLTFVDWSRAARFFGGERQLGVFARQQLRQGELVRPEWALGVYSGTNARSAFEGGPSLVFDVPQPNPSDLRDPAAPASLHPEVVGQVGLRIGQDDFGSDSDLEGGPPRLHVATGVAFDADPVQDLEFALRIAPEFLVKWAHVSLSAQGYLAWFEAANDTYDFAASGLNVQAAWRFLPYLEVAARHARVWVAEAYRVASLPSRNLGPDDAGFEGFDETTGALSFYAFDHELKVVTDVSIRRRRENGATVQDEMFRLQVQLAF